MMSVEILQATLITALPVDYQEEMLIFEMV